MYVIVSKKEIKLIIAFKKKQKNDHFLQFTKKHIKLMLLSPVSSKGAYIRCFKAAVLTLVIFFSMSKPVVRS